MNPIRTITDAGRAIGLLWQEVFLGDTIVRIRTTIPAVIQFLANGETLVRDGGTAIGVPSGWVDRSPGGNVTVRAGGSLIVAGPYTVTTTITVEDEAVLMVL